MKHFDNLRIELEGAHVTHNHPRGSVNEYSFSDADIGLFMNFNLSILHGVDEFFIYELNQNAEDIDDVVPPEKTNEFNSRNRRAEHWGWTVVPKNLYLFAENAIAVGVKLSKDTKTCRPAPN